MPRKPIPDAIRNSPEFQLWIKGLKPHTRNVYGWYFAALLKAAGMTPKQVLTEAKKDINALWRKVKPLANNLSSAHGKKQALYAFRRFLVDNGYEDLPRARIDKPGKVKKPRYMRWDQALAICGAASRPYNLMFKLMLHCGWGIGEFFDFNTQETWENIKRHLSSNPTAEYYRYDFPQRKTNTEAFYSLIPTTVLRDILQLSVELPLSTKGSKSRRGVPLDKAHYHTSQENADAAFNTARNKAPVTVQGKPTPHDLRDTFRTRADFVGCSNSAAEFAMGHQIDPLEYKKTYYDEAYMWNELKKIYGSAPVTEVELQSRDKTIAEMQQQIEMLQAEKQWQRAIMKGELDPDMLPQCDNCTEYHDNYIFDGKNFKCLQCGGTQWRPIEPPNYDLTEEARTKSRRKHPKKKKPAKRKSRLARMS